MMTPVVGSVTPVVTVFEEVFPAVAPGMVRVPLSMTDKIPEPDGVLMLSTILSHFLPQQSTVTVSLLLPAFGSTRTQMLAVDTGMPVTGSSLAP